MHNSTNAVQSLIWVDALQDVNTLLLILVLEVADEVSLHASDELTKLASKALLSLLEHARDVRLSASVLVRQLVSVLIPEALQELLNFAFLALCVPGLRCMWFFLQMIIFELV